MPTFCPATMCPLFAAQGSPWTGQRDSHCEREECAWFFDGRCAGGVEARGQIELVAQGGVPLQIGPGIEKASVTPKSFDCPRATECQWQAEAGDELCPPRTALSKGVDPRACAY